MNKILKFGEDVEGFNFPVLNEREIRAAAGLLFLFAYSAFLVCQITQNFIMLKYVITMFFLDMVIRVFVNPRYSPTLIIGRFMVRNQTPEYVSAKPKRFAWSIGVALAALLFTVQVVLNWVSPITGLTCIVCLTFFFFEAVFGICLGCKFYPLFFRKDIERCPGEVCDPREKQNIQKISKWQVLTVIGFVVVLSSLVYFFHDSFREKPYHIFRTDSSTQLE